jgi:hypothetical protein
VAAALVRVITCKREAGSSGGRVAGHETWSVTDSGKGDVEAPAKIIFSLGLGS